MTKSRRSRAKRSSSSSGGKKAATKFGMNDSMRKTMMAMWAIGALTTKEATTGQVVPDAKCENLLKVLEINSPYKHGAQYQEETIKNYISTACEKLEKNDDKNGKAMCKALVKYVLSDENCSNVWKIVEAKQEAAEEAKK